MLTPLGSSRKAFNSNRAFPRFWEAILANLEFPLAQGWSRGLTIGFEDAQSSRGLDLNRSFHVDQVHGKEIYQVSPSDLSKSGALAKADGLYAQGDWFKECGRALVVKSADCVPLFFIDRQSEAVCAIHAGWRGLQQGIHRVPFEKGWFDPKFTWIWMGPCLSGTNFEVGQDMWSQFAPEAQRDPQLFQPHPTDSSKRFFHTWTFVDRDLKKLGVDLVYNVETDTFEDREFASYRRARKGGLEKAEDRNLSWLAFAPREAVVHSV